MKVKLIFGVAAVGIVLILGGFLAFVPLGKKASVPQVVKKQVVPAQKEKQVVFEPKTVQFEVPFTSQAPLNEWSDPRQQDACEEAAVLMAVKWARGEQIASKEAALVEILAVSAFQTEKFRGFHDTSAQDTIERIFKEYFHFESAYLLSDATLEQIIQELNRGNLVIAPMNGQALHNSHYTALGPERHMILITGYDVEKNEFVTNDAGTTVGEDFRYPTQLFFDAIRDYPTGDHVPIVGTLKNVIVVSEGS